MYRQNTYGILLQNISTGLQLFWDYFFHKKNPSETWTHPPTSIVISDFFLFFLCTAPKGKHWKAKKTDVKALYHSFKLSTSLVYNGSNVTFEYIYVVSAAKQYI